MNGIWKFSIPCLLVGVSLVSCAAGGRGELEEVRRRQDTLSVKLDFVSRRLDGLDSVRADVRKIRLLTDYVGAKLAKQEREARPTQSDRIHAIDQGGSFASGPDTASVTMVTFTDYECPFCRHLSPVLDSFASRHRTDLRWIAKNFPLDIHANAKALAVAVVVAGKQGKYFEFQSKLMSGQLDPSREGLMRIAKDLRLDLDRFKRDLDDPRVSEPLLAEEFNQAQDLGVLGTPTVFLNGRQIRASSASDLENAYANTKKQLSISQEGN